jgi:ATP-dependent Lhr-like helicase
VGDRPRVPREAAGRGDDADPAPSRAKRREEGGCPATRILYVSPLKALGVDVERNLRSPLVGIGQSARRLGIPVPEVTVGVRSGDTVGRSPQAHRRPARHPHHDARVALPDADVAGGRDAARVHTVIVDEVHAVAATKRGAHLAVSLERLDALLERPAQRIGLSATVRPIDEVARFLGGSAPVEIVARARRRRSICASSCRSTTC